MSNRPRDQETLTPSISPDKKPSGGISYGIYLHLALVTNYFQNKLDKEQAYSRMNTAKLNQAWRYILRRVKCKQMALDIQVSL